MIRIKNQPFRGIGIGNKFFIYSYSRLLAEKLGYSLESDETICCENLSDKISIKFDNIIGDNFSSNEEIYDIDDGFSLKYENIDNAIEFLKNKNLNILSSGYYQKYSYWKKYKKTVKSYFTKFTSEELYGDDKICLHLRSCPWDPRFALPTDYYLESIEKLGNKQIYIFYDFIHMHEETLKKLEHLNPIIMHLNPIESMKEITKFKYIICSNGSFSFWGSFLSEAKKIICPIDDIFPNEHSKNSSIDYYVDDEDRYEYVKINKI